MPYANAGTEIANPPTTASARIALMTLSFPSGGGTAALVKDGQPLAGIVAMFAANLIEDSDGFGGAREHGQLVGQAAEIQFHHDGIVTLLDQKPPTFGDQIVSDELELGAGEAESIDIINLSAVGVGQEDLGGDLLHYAVRDVRSQSVSRALRPEHQKGILLPVGLQAVLREGAEGIIAQRLPELVDVDHEATAIEQGIDPVEHVHHQRRADQIGRAHV